MTPFEQSVIDWKGKSIAERIQGVQKTAQELGRKCTWAQAKQEYRRLASEEIWINDLYQVHVNRDPDAVLPFMKGKMVHLSIRSLDRNAKGATRPVRNWRHFQQIKNELVGPDHEAVELYPAESRLVDTVNQYHLWCYKDAENRFPFGWFERLVDYGDKNEPNENP